MQKSFSEALAAAIKNPLSADFHTHTTFCDGEHSVATRLLCLWDCTVKNTGVGCHFLLHERSTLKTRALKKQKVKVRNRQTSTNERRLSC